MKIAVVLTARPSWSKLEPVCRALKAKPDVELQIIACASALLERYGNVSAVVERSGFAISERVWSVYEGESLLTSAKETGALLTELATTLFRLRPGVVLVCADRHEVLAGAQAAAYCNLPLCHMQGGERTGSIDDKVRDAITQLADYHLVCTERAKHRVYGLTGDWAHIWNTGCPSIDLAKQALSEPPVTAEELGGAGAAIDLSRPFLVVLQHPVTSEVEDAGQQIDDTLEACVTYQRLPTLVFWPGQDAGGGQSSKVIRASWSRHPLVHTVRNLPPLRFLRLLTQAACLVGNSSAGIRECSYLGVPVVNIGTRQTGRERGPNVADVEHWLHDPVQDISVAITSQLQHGPYQSSALYGRGDAGIGIAEVLVGLRQSRSVA